MFTLKKFSFSLLSLGLLTCINSPVAEAQYGGGYALCGGWYIQAEAFDVRATDTLFSRLSYAFLEDRRSILPPPTPKAIPVGNRNDRFKFFSIPPEYEWGFRAAVGYDFPSCSPCTNYGFSLEYTYFKNDQDDHTRTFLDDDGREANVLLPVVSSLGFDFRQLYSHANADFDIRYDAIDLLAHKNIFLQNCSTVQLFAGVRYAHLREDYDVHFRIDGDTEEPFVSPTVRDNIRFDNRFDGIGPRVGGNVFYNIAGGFGVAGELAGSLIFGETNSNFSEHIVSDFVNTTYQTSSHSRFRNHDDHHDANIVVPALSGKVALAFRTTFCNCTKLGIELGVRGDRYFGIADNSAFVEAVNFFPNLSSPAADGQFLNKDSNFHDFSFAGPYLSISIHA